MHGGLTREAADANGFRALAGRRVASHGRRCASLRVVNWLAVSLVLSVVLTVALNLALRVFPGAGDRAARKLAELSTPTDRDADRRDAHVRVYVPWKAMLVGSLILTIVLNVVLRLF